MVTLSEKTFSLAIIFRGIPCCGDDNVGPRRVYPGTEGTGQTRNSSTQKAFSMRDRRSRVKSRRRLCCSCEAVEVRASTTESETCCTWRAVSVSMTWMSLNLYQRRACPLSRTSCSPATSRRVRDIFRGFFRQRETRKILQRTVASKTCQCSGQKTIRAHPQSVIGECAPCRRRLFSLQSGFSVLRRHGELCVENIFCMSGWTMYVFCEVDW